MSDPTPPPLPLAPLLAPSSGPHLRAHAVPWQHALTWYEDALRLFKRRPGIWIALAFITLASELALQLLADPWPLLGKVLAPLFACGMLYAAAAADRHAAPRLRYAFSAFRAPPGAIAAIVVASLIAFAAEVFAAWWIADVNLMLGHAGTDELTTPAIMGVYAIGVLASLPVAFVPLHVLLEPVAFGDAFLASWHAFVLNTAPLLVYAGLSLVLLAVGLATMGFALLLVLPIWAGSSYAAWKDIFGVGAAPVLD